MPEKTQALVSARVAEIRELAEKLAKVRLTGRAKHRQAERLAAAIQARAASVRSEIRKLQD